MLAALALPRILTRINDRTIMIAGGGLLLVTLATLGLVFRQAGIQTLWVALLVGWLAMGIGYSLCVTPNGKLLRREPGQFKALAPSMKLCASATLALGLRRSSRC